MMEAAPQLMAAGVRVWRDVPSALRDGTILRSDVYRPASPGKYPVLLMRVPYNKAVAQAFVYQHPAWYARHGFVVVVQDCRGRYASDGTFEPVRHEANDGYDAIEWAAGLEESNGRVGMYGFSYAGATQLLAASEQPPSLKCCIPAFTASDFYDGWMYDGGVLNLAFVVSWTVQMLAFADAIHAGDPAAAGTIRRRSTDFPALFNDRPLSQFELFKQTGLAPYFFDWLHHDTRDEYWTSIGLPERYDRITVPCLHIGGWFDMFSRGTVQNYQELRRRAGNDPAREQRLMMGPWIHVPWAPEAAGAALGPSQRHRVDDAQLAWFDRWLRDADDVQRTSPVSYFVMGSNTWTATNSWPPPDTANKSLYLSSGGRANSRAGDGELSDQPPAANCPPDLYVYDPSNPVPSAGGNSCCNAAVAPMGQACQAGVEVRNDVLIYTSRVLTDDTEVSGVATVILYAATSACDTDWVARLVDVAPTGTALNISQGIVRARFSQSLDQPHLIEAEAVTRYTISLNPTSWLFKSGHRIRLQVTSSDFPAKEPNLNTGARQDCASVSEYMVATQTVFHDADHLSTLCLPVPPAAARNEA